MNFPSYQDPLGQALLEYWEGLDTPDILVRSDIAEDDYYQIGYYFREEKNMPEWEKIALSHCRGKVLDIGAGSGCHSVLLQKRGLVVDAIDSSPGAVQVMKARGLKSVFLGNFFDFQGGAYDTLLMLMNGLGIVGNFQGLRTFLELAKSWLNPGGQILLDSSDIAYLLEDEEILSQMLSRDSAFGEVVFQLCYKDMCGEVFPWLYLDYESLDSIASSMGYSCELLAKGIHFEYLAKLSPTGNSPQKSISK